MTMEDSYFEPETIKRLKAGETVPSYHVKNKGELVHEFNIGTAAMHAEHQKGNGDDDGARRALGGRSDKP
ncbi:MAG: hypothetical protein IPM60_16975 [Rhodospirillales bacterium]|nr:hypothetical protein [Rhodospirillales bacterium]